MNRMLAAGIWNLDPSQSSATFVAHQLGRSIPGRIPIRSASADIGPERDICRAHSELDLGSTSTGIEKRDIDLAKPRLLNTGQFPALSVDVAPVGWTGTGWRANGKLGVRGTEFPVDLAITVEDTESTETVGVLITTAFKIRPHRHQGTIFCHRTEHRGHRSSNLQARSGATHLTG